jgi:hypothetical protein
MLTFDADKEATAKMAKRLQSKKVIKKKPTGE